MKISDSSDALQLSEAERKLARDSADLIERSASGSLVVFINDRKLELPRALSSVIGSTLRMAGEGREVALVPFEVELGTQEAADWLGVSRPYLVKLLDQGVIPSRKVGVQRRVLACDVAAYQEKERNARKRVLAELAEEDRKLGLDE